MRVALLSILAAVALAAAAPAAGAQPTDAGHSKSQPPRPFQFVDHRAGDPAVASAKAQEQYYGSYGRSVTSPEDSSPLPAIGIGVGLIVVVAGSVAAVVHTRRRTGRVRAAT